MTSWHKVSDALPEPGEKVLIYTWSGLFIAHMTVPKGIPYHAGLPMPSRLLWTYAEDKDPLPGCYVTHWAPIDRPGE